MSGNFLENEIISETKNKEVPENDEVINPSETIKNKSNDHIEINNSIFKTGATMEHNEILEETKPYNSDENINSEELNDDEEEHDGWLDILGSGGIMKKTIQEGKSESRPTRSDKCTINYTCSLEDGTVVESTNHFQFFLGEADVSIVISYLKCKSYGFFFIIICKLQFCIRFNCFNEVG